MDSIVGILKKLGAKGLEKAIDWLEENKASIDAKIFDMIVAKVKAALEEVGLNPFDALEVLSFKDWLESVGDKIVDIIEAGKEIGKEAGEAIKVTERNGTFTVLLFRSCEVQIQALQNRRRWAKLSQSDRRINPSPVILYRL